MAIKPVDPIAEIGAAREVKLLQSQTRRPSQRPAQAEKTPANSALPSVEAEQSKQAERKPEEAEATPAPEGNPSLRFHVDQDTGKTVAELVGPDGQVLRQMPTEEALEIAKAIGRYQGMFVDLKV